MIKIKQGDIVWASLDPIKGHEQAGMRPVLILQNDLFNEHLNAVLAVPLTTNLKTKDFVSTYFLESKVNADELHALKLRLALLL